MKLIVDAMGGDNAPQAIVQGCIDAAHEYGTKITLVGVSDILGRELNARNAPKENFEIIHADEVIGADESPVMAIRRKKNSSMVKAVELLKEYRDGVVISAGNTGALMASGLLKAGRIEGIDRPALAPLVPTRNMRGTLLLDAGANTDCTSDNLMQFALMGSIYMEKVMGRNNPSIALLNIGHEETKGNELAKETYRRMKEMKNINFIGNVEPRDIVEGAADVLVCDGFVGNVVLKLIEGVALSLFGMLKQEFMATTVSKLGALMLKPRLKNIKAKMDYAEHGGAPLLGINGGIIKAHGSSDSKAIKNAIRQGKIFIEQEVLENIRNFAHIKS